MQRYLIIDGYNAIAKIKSLAAVRDKNLEAARIAFIRILNVFMNQKRMFDKIFIVFDSKEKVEGVRRQLYGKVEVLFTTCNRDADRVIVELLRKASPADRVSVSSDDNFVRNHAKGYGRDVISISELEEIIMLKKRGLRGKIYKNDLENEEISQINEELKKYWGIE